MSTKTDQVNALFAEWDREDSPGCAVAVVQDGEIVHSRGYGVADLEHSAALTPRSVFDIASTSKQFTAFCAALLARQGALDLDAEIQTYLPQMPRYAGAITPRHLIHHTSGLRDYLSLLELAGSPFENVYTDAEIGGLIARQQGLNFMPGERFLYCNSGYYLLGEIVRRAAGTTLRAFAEAQLFGPLGMGDTHFHDDYREIVPGRAVGYGPRDGGGWRSDMSFYDLVGDGGIYTTAADLALWDANFYDNVLGYGQDLIAEITTPGRLNSGAALEYAFGLFVKSYRGLQTISHGGSWMGYRSELMRFPQQRFSVICLANLDSINPSLLARRVADIYLAGAFKEPPPAPPRAAAPAAPEMEEMAGFYYSVESGAVWEMRVGDGRLTAAVNGEFFKLAADAPDSFVAVDSPYEVRLTFEGREPRLLRAEVEEELPDLLRKLERFVFDPARLADYAGEYESGEVGASIALWVENDALYFGRRYAAPERLKPAGEDLFVSADEALLGYWVFKFARSAAGEVTAVDLTGFGIRDLRFTRQGSA